MACLLYVVRNCFKCRRDAEPVEVRGREVLRVAGVMTSGEVERIDVREEEQWLSVEDGSMPPRRLDRLLMEENHD